MYLKSMPIVTVAPMITQRRMDAPSSSSMAMACPATITKIGTVTASPEKTIECRTRNGTKVANSIAAHRIGRLAMMRLRTPKSSQRDRTLRASKMSAVPSRTNRFEIAVATRYPSA